MTSFFQIHIFPAFKNIIPGVEIVLLNNLRINQQLYTVFSLFLKDMVGWSLWATTVGSLDHIKAI
jgi:hypothetical protein